MAVYNAEKYLSDAIQSVLDQPLQEIELICVNDGSTDESLKILHEYANKDSRVHVFTHENHGASYTRNVALIQATGEYLHILDGDDMVPKGAYKRMYEEAKKNNLDVLFFDGDVLYENDFLEGQYKNASTYYKRKKGYNSVVTGEELFCALIKDNTYRTAAGLYLMRNEYIKKNNILFYEGITHEDHLFTFLCITKAKRAAHINEPLFIRRIRSGSVMTGSVSYKNVIGLLTCFTEIYFFFFRNITNNSMKKAVLKELFSIANSALEKYTFLDKQEQSEVKDNSLFPVQALIWSFFDKYNKLMEERNYFAGQKKENFCLIYEIPISKYIEIMKQDVYDIISINEDTDGSVIVYCGDKDPQVYIPLENAIEKPSGFPCAKITFANSKKGYLQVYYNYGDGLNEENSFRHFIDANNEEATIELPVAGWHRGEMLIGIRVDPPYDTRFVFRNLKIGYSA
jgi:glycosyltransferase involved in cell wall biosynthesis